MAKGCELLSDVLRRVHILAFAIPILPRPFPMLMAAENS